MQQSDWRSYAAKVIEVFKQPGQKYDFEDMLLWDISIPVNELDKETRKVIVLEEIKFKGLSKWTNFLRQHS